MNTNLPCHVIQHDIILAYRDDGNIDNFVEGLHVLATKQVCSDLVYDILQAHLLMKVSIDTARDNFVEGRYGSPSGLLMVGTRRTLLALVEQLVNGTQP
jgi:hypothetical protein